MPPRIARRTFTAACAGIIAGCAGTLPATGDAESTATPADNPAVGTIPQMGDVTLTSPAFDDGGPIPAKYGKNEKNVNPPLQIATVPAGAKSLVLIVDDPDAVEPAGEVWLHWLVWNIDPSRREIPEDWQPSTEVGENDFGNRRYDGPAPPKEPHTYRFKLFVLDTTLDLSESASTLDVGRAMTGHRRAQTQLEGTFAPA